MEVKKKSFIEKINETGSAQLNYYGSHPLLSRECKVNLSTKEGIFKFGTLFKQIDVPLSEIQKVYIANEKEITERFTATRIALFGPFALAMKKKKIKNKKYMVIECNDFTLTFDGEGMIAGQFCEKLYKNVLKDRN